MELRAGWRPGDRFLVRHADPAILVVEKKAGLLTHGTPKGDEPNLLDLLRDFIGHRGKKGDLFPVHRLDRVVSGLLVYARTRAAQDQLIEQFAAHDVERAYLACVEGLLPEDEGTFESWLRVDHPSLRVFSVDGPGEGIKRGITHWRVLERLTGSQKTLVEVQLETGVRNQIRVHLAEAGFPLLGELKYLDAYTRQAQGRTRVFLHAQRLGFVHPVTGKKVRWVAELPPDLSAWLQKLRISKKSSAPEAPATRRRSGHTRR